MQNKIIGGIAGIGPIFFKSYIFAKSVQIIEPSISSFSKHLLSTFCVKHYETFP